MGNAVGPVALIAAGIYLGYLTLSGRTIAFVNFLKGGTVSAPGTTTTTGGSTSTAGTSGGISTLSTVTNPWGIWNPGGVLGIATAQQAAANAQIPLTIDSLSTSGGG